MVGMKGQDLVETVFRNAWPVIEKRATFAAKASDDMRLWHQSLHFGLDLIIIKIIGP